jgi:hypothetical protein
MSYELHNDAGEHMQLLRGEWEMLLELARLEGWVPARGDLDHYASGGTVSLVDAAGLAAAIRRALPNVPAHYADGLRVMLQGVPAFIMRVLFAALF